MIRRALRIAIAQERRSALAALAMALVAILFAQMILPGALALAFHEVRGAPPQPGGGADSTPPPVPFPTERLPLP